MLIYSSTLPYKFQNLQMQSLKKEAIDPSFFILLGLPFFENGPFKTVFILFVYSFLKDKIQ
jgi:hypothetical protein